MYILFNLIVSPIIISEKIAYQKPAKIAYFRPFFSTPFCPKTIYLLPTTHHRPGIYAHRGRLSLHPGPSVPIISHLESRKRVRDKFANNFRGCGKLAKNLRRTGEGAVKNWQRGKDYKTIYLWRMCFQIIKIVFT